MIFTKLLQSSLQEIFINNQQYTHILSFALCLYLFILYPHFRRIKKLYYVLSWKLNTLVHSWPKSGLWHLFWTKGLQSKSHLQLDSDWFKQASGFLSRLSKKCYHILKTNFLLPKISDFDNILAFGEKEYVLALVILKIDFLAKCR